MTERICLMTFCPTKCKDDCFNCDCGGQGATKDMYVSINNVQRVCAIQGNAADTNEGAYIAEVIRNNLESMVIEAHPVKRGRWIWDSEPELGNPYGSYRCSECGNRMKFQENYCCECGARMDGDTNG